MLKLFQSDSILRMRDIFTLFLHAIVIVIRLGCRWRWKKGPTQRWSGYFSLCPFPSWKGVFSQNGPQRSRARRRCAAKRTLHGEDRSEILDKRERGGPKWTAKMAQSLTASDKGMRTSRIQAWYQNPKKHLILAQFSNSPWTGRLRRTLQNFTV